MNEFDVIVVGGGPAGSTAATFCARRGVRVALFEHRKFPRHKVCGDVINPNGWPVLERLGLAEKIRALPQQRLTGALFSTPDGSQIAVEADGMIAVRRSLFDAALLEHARTCGVEVFEEETVHEVDADRHVVTSRHGYIGNLCIIGADGRNSVVARKIGLARENNGGNGHVAFQSHFRAPKAMDGRVQLHLFPGGYCGVVRVDEDRVNLCIVTGTDAARERCDCEALFARTVWRNPRFRALGIAPEPLEPLRSAHPLCVPARVPCRNGVFLVGDALRVTEPFTGQGIFFALRTAELAAEAICEKKDYARSVAQLYRQRASTNELLRRLMYRQRAAGLAVSLLRGWPGALRWLAGNVVAG